MTESVKYTYSNLNQDEENDYYHTQKEGNQRESHSNQVNTEYIGITQEMVNGKP